ncbi:hypothetical protein [Sphingomonas daechungensis]|uniref:hypothetical protein n=1 Tax=Sphingomonas daechungensis TaxID=1176646 RepID=UPI001CB9BA36|nr:hypothetical protein [Sphingomonas daechungensis]
MNFGGGADTLTLTGTSIFTGQLSGSAGLAVNLGAGTKLQATNLGTVGLASLTTGAGSGIGVTIDSSTTNRPSTTSREQQTSARARPSTSSFCRSAASRGHTRLSRQAR